MGPDPLLLHLHKLRFPAGEAAESSADPLAEVLETLWNSRKTGLGSHEKPHIQSLLGLPTLQELDPVLACLRLIMRKCVQEKLTGDDIQKLFPPDLPIKLQSTLVMLFQKYEDEWREEASRDQNFWPPQQRPTVSNQVKFIAPPVFTSRVSPSSMWPRQDGATSSTNSNLDNGSLNGPASLPQLKSMTWTMENNRKSLLANRVAIITLKLQDYTKSPSGEIEVKFQVSKDTLEAMLRSMSYISEQLANSVQM